MRTRYTKRFLKDLAAIPGQYRQRVERFGFDEVPAATRIADTKLSPMVGHSGFFKARFGPYRVGVESDEGGVIFRRALHRREIYRYFP